MTRTARLAAVGLALLCMAGCGRLLVGHWKGADLANQDKTVFSFATMQFNEDGTFKGVATLEAKNQDLAGTYQFDGFKLKLDTQQGRQEYWASYNMFGPDLLVKHDHNKAKLERVGK
jgi:hypothetical protein